jgi:hypothetical protein
MYPFWTRPDPRGYWGGCPLSPQLLRRLWWGAGAAGYGLVAWGLGTEAPTPAEARQNIQQNIQQLQKDLLTNPRVEARDDADDGAAGALVPASEWHGGPRRPRYDERPGFGNGFRPGLLCLERMTGIEPALSAWEADVLPLNYIRRSARAAGGGLLGRPCPHIVQEQVACLRAPLRS